MSINSTTRNLTGVQVDGVTAARNYLPGTFENGALGWTVSSVTLSNGLPPTTANPTFTTSTAINISTTTTNPLSGKASLQLTSSGSTTAAGTLVLSPSFTLDRGDMAKVLTGKFSYEVVSGATGLNFSGILGSQSIGVYLYNQTTGLFMQPGGFLGLTQSVGPATSAPFTLQTNNAVETYQLAFVVLQAATANFTINIDDINISRTVQTNGTPVTDSIPFTMNITAATTAPTKPTTRTETATWKRVGDRMEIDYVLYFTSATGSAAGSGIYYFNLPSGYTIDTTKIANPNGQSAVGYGRVADNNVSSDLTVVINGGNAQNNQLCLAGKYSANSATGSVTDFYLSSANLAITDTAVPYSLSFHASVPIAGWSSNVSMSNDTDTRVVSLLASQNSNQSYTSGPIPMTAVADRVSGWTGTQYKVSVSGDYSVSATVLNSNSHSLFIYKNNVQYLPLSTNTGGFYTGGSALVMGCVAGDLIDIRENTSGTIGFAQISINRLSGPAVVAATESVNATYALPTTTAIATGGAIPYSSRIKDTHNAFNTSTFIFTAPTSGQYRISVVTISSGVSSLYAKVNGVSVGYIVTSISSAIVSGSISVFAQAGQTIGVYGDAAANFQGAAAQGPQCQITFERTGN